MKGIRQPKSSKFLSESEFFMMTDATDASNAPRFPEAITVCGGSRGGLDLKQGNIRV